ncbi:MAG: cation-transporting P-type ATPase [Candidatus Riflebacteria bacterium]|nr:cation-transporting P-type ATPase [Candidatus Riflebacteria bacterium]
MTTRIGLTSFEVEQRRKCRPATPGSSGSARLWWRMFLEKFEDPIIRLLGGTAILSFLIGLPQGDYVEGLAVVLMILAIASVGLAGEWLALRQFIRSLEDPDQTWYTVLRDGEAQGVPLRDLVPEDCVVLEPGDRIPADGAVIEEAGLEVAPPLPGSGAGSRSGLVQATEGGNRLRAGMVVTAGRALWRLAAWPDLPSPARILETAWRMDRTTPLGRQTEALVGWAPALGMGTGLAMFLVLLWREQGRLGSLLPPGALWLFFSVGTGLAFAAAFWWMPPLYRTLSRLGFEVPPHPPWPLEADTVGPDPRRVGLAVAGILLIIGMAIGFLPPQPGVWMTMAGFREVLRILLLILAILVAVVPDGLGMNVALGLVWAVHQMNGCGARVRRMQIVESIGAIDVLCHDLEGVMTRLRPCVSHVWQEQVPVQRLDGGTGTLLETAIRVTCADTRLCLPAGQPPIVLGEPIAGALLTWLHEQHREPGPRTTPPLPRMVRLETAPGWWAALAWPTEDEEDPHLFVRGPASLLAGPCGGVARQGKVIPSPDTMIQVRRLCEEAEARGERIQGFAWKPWGKAPITPRLHDRALDGLAWLGAISCSDPTTDEYPAIRQTLARAGIRVHLVSAHPGPVVRRVLAELGGDLAGDPFLVAKVAGESGPAEGLSRAEAVRQRREGGTLVAATGWRPEDIPVLAEASIGIALGPAAPQRVKEASDVIVPDLSLQPVIRAVALSRTFFRNIRRYLVFQTVVNGLILGASLLGPLFGLGFPLTVMEMLWVHFLLDSVTALAMATESPDPDILDGPPTDITRPLLSLDMAGEIFAQSAFVLAGFLGLQVALGRSGLAADHARSLLFSAFVFLVFWVLWSCRWFGTRQPHPNRAWDNPLFSTMAAFILIGQMAIVQLGGRFFQTVPLVNGEWLALLAGTGAFVGAFHLLWARRPTAATRP